MTRRHRLIAATVLLGLTLGNALPAFAKLHVAPLGLDASNATCDSGRKGSYTYKAQWQGAAPNMRYTLHTGNQCRVGAQVCGIALSTGCAVTCNAKGVCSTTVNACVATAAPAGQWLKVLGSDGGWQQVKALAPSKCS